MSITSKKFARTSNRNRSSLWTAAADWVTRPNRHKGVHNFSMAAESADLTRLASLLDPEVAVVVDDGHAPDSATRVVCGISDATTLLVHGMAAGRGLVIEERSINGQAGLLLNHDDETVAAINVDFRGRLISVVWIRLHPRKLRHWNRV
jgi:hypothetical protein